MAPTKIKWPEPAEIHALIADRGTGGAAAFIGCSPRTLRDRLQRLREGTVPEDGKVTFTLDELPESDWKPDALLKAHGLDPDEWKVVRVRGNRWGDPDEPNAQLRIDAVPVVAPFKFPTLENWTPLPKPKARKTKGPRTSVVISDHHCPHEDRTFHVLFCQWLKDEQPDLIEVNGDLMDFADISRHRVMPGNHDNPVNECLQSAFNVLHDYRQACPNAHIRLKLGNHCNRLQYALIDNLKALYNVTAANEEVPALSFRKLLHLDELHVELVEEEWDKAKTRIGKRVTAVHGYSTSKNPGTKILTDLTGSTLQGHSHRMSLLYRTSHHPDDGTETRLAGECGCACEIGDGLGYTSAPDWQQGCMVVKTWPDEDFTVAPLVYLPGRLLCPDGRRYVA